MSRARVLSSAAVVCYVNGVPFGRVTHFSWRSSTVRRAIYGLDTVDPSELAPTVTKCVGSVKLYRTVGDGGLQGAGMSAGYEDLPREKYFSLQLIDRGSDQVLFQAEYCTVNNESWDVAIKAVVTGSLEFEALAWSNEIKPLGVSGQ